jgi:hypothetical protein
MVLMSVVVVCVLVVGRRASVPGSSYVLRVCGGVWGSALLHGGGVECVLVVMGKWCAGFGVGVVANVGAGCAGGGGGLGICVWVVMVVCCDVVGVVVVVVCCFR